MRKSGQKFSWYQVLKKMRSNKNFGLKVHKYSMEGRLKNRKSVLWLQMPSSFLFGPAHSKTLDALIWVPYFLIFFFFNLNFFCILVQGFFFSFIFISWRLITLQYCSGFCHTLTWISHGFTCIPHPDPPSHLPLCPIPLGLPSAPGPSTCLMHPTWAGDLFHPW